MRAGSHLKSVLSDEPLVTASHTMRSVCSVIVRLWALMGYKPPYGSFVGSVKVLLWVA